MTRVRAEHDERRWCKHALASRGEAVATGLQLAVFHALEAANDPDGGAESGIQGLH